MTPSVLSAFHASETTFTTIATFALLALTLSSLLSLWLIKSESKFPLVGEDTSPSSESKAAADFAKDALKVLKCGLKMYSGPFRVHTATGSKIVLPARYLEEIKSDKRFSFAHEMAKQSLSHLRGFEAFSTPLHDNIFQETIRVKITQSLGRISEALSEETTIALERLLGGSAEWIASPISRVVLDLTTILSTRVFLGEKFSRDQKWLDLSQGYTMCAFMAGQSLWKWPSFLQPLANRVLPICIGQQAMLKAIRRILDPEIERRKSSTIGMPAGIGKDTIDWMQQLAHGRPFDLVSGQLQLGFVAIHTTSTLLTEVLLDICAYPEYVPILREEIVKVLREDGWKKTSMYKLKKMDSFVKEVLRLRPQSMITARRMVTEDVTLSDGVVLPKGTSTMIPIIDVMFNPQVYPEPEKFDGLRFFRMRSVNEGKAQLIAANAEYLGFGYGQHACPGRFLAANEIKIAMCHLLLKYDFKFLPGESRPRAMAWEVNYMTNPALKIMIRRRREEVDLSSPDSPAT